MLNPDLDLEDLSAQFRRKKRLLIPNILRPDAAERVWQCMVRETPWGLVYNEGEKIVYVSAAQLEAMGPQERIRRCATAEARAAREFQYLYRGFPLLDHYEAGRHRDLYHMRVYEALNGAEFLDFARTLSGISSIVRADAQATLYGPRHFLKLHDDNVLSHHPRRIAYVLNFTKTWEADWGGALQFFDDDMNVAETFLPGFNTLSIFTVPQWHSVSFVVPFAPVGRFAITGWFQDPLPNAFV